MLLAVFLASVAVSIVGGVVAVTRGIGLWRQTRRTAGTLSRELQSFEERSARTEQHLAEWERSSARLDEALERLRVSRARLRVLQDALEQAQARVRWLRVFAPR